MSSRKWLQALNKRSGQSRRPGAAGQRRRGRPGLERLEDRIQPTVITVTGMDDGPGVLTQVMPGMFVDTTLRGAINAANTDPDVAVQIDFDTSVFVPRNNTIALSGSLPSITRDHVKVDDNDVPVTLDGSGAGASAIGLQITGAPDRDETVLSLAAAFQDETDFHRRRPEL